VVRAELVFAVVALEGHINLQSAIIAGVHANGLAFIKYKFHITDVYTMNLKSDIVSTL
jgi:hypothetical protein